MVARMELPAAIALSAAAATVPAFLPLFVGMQMILQAAAALRVRRSRLHTAFDGLLALLTILAALAAIVAPFPLSTMQALRLLSGIGLFRAALGASVHDLTSTRTLIGLAAAALVSAATAFVAELAPFSAPQIFVPLAACAAFAPRTAMLSRPLRAAFVAAAMLGVIGAAPNSIPLLIVAAAAAVAATHAAWAARALPYVVGTLALSHLLLLFGPHTWTNALLFLHTPAQIAAIREAWDRALLLVHTLPFTGAGPGGYALVVDALLPLSIAPQATDAHNLMLQIASDFGIPGGLVLGTILARIVTQRSSVDVHWLRHAALCALAAILIDGVTTTTLWLASPVAPLAWLIVGGAVRLHESPMETHTMQGAAQ
jgi:hypothetical protein